MFGKLKQNWFHLLIWIGLLIYLKVAPGIYADIFIKAGRPIIQETLEVSSESDKIWYSVDNITQITIDGNRVYDLWGWAFFLDDVDQKSFERYISLTSDKMTYYFSLDTIKRQDVEDHFEEIDLDVSQSGFSAHISKEFIETGSYKITLLFRDKMSKNVYRKTTNATLIRTPNTLTLSKKIGE